MPEKVTRTQNPTIRGGILLNLRYLLLLGHLLKISVESGGPYVLVSKCQTFTWYYKTQDNYKVLNQTY